VNLANGINIYILKAILLVDSILRHQIRKRPFKSDWRRPKSETSSRVGIYIYIYIVYSIEGRFLSLPYWSLTPMLLSIFAIIASYLIKRSESRLSKLLIDEGGQGASKDKSFDLSRSGARSTGRRWNKSLYEKPCSCITTDTTKLDFRRNKKELKLLAISGCRNRLPDHNIMEDGRYQPSHISMGWSSLFMYDAVTRMMRGQPIWTSSQYKIRISFWDHFLSRLRGRTDLPKSNWNCLSEPCMHWFYPSATW